MKFFLRQCGIVLALLWCSAAVFAAQDRAEDWKQLRQQFKEVPMEARRLTGPLFWLHNSESDEKLENYLEIVAEGHNGTFCAESRPHTDWLGEEWYDDLRVCLEKAKELNLTMWIFDEKWWPSGMVGGNVPNTYGPKTMQAQADTVEGPAQFTAEGYGGKHFIAVLAGRQTDGGVDGDSLRDLAAHVENGKLAWQVPDGTWRIMKFTWKYTETEPLVVDGASERAVNWYLDTVYRPHYERFREDFGETIQGYFYDEPHTPGDWGTEVIPLLKERGVNWKKALTAWKFRLASPAHAAARYQYRHAFAEAWGRTLYGGITRWCHERGVLSIGHFLEHGKLYLDDEVCAGNMFQLQKYSDMGGIDAVFKQFVMGQREPQRDSHTWETPKLASSISHVYDKPQDLSMIEIYGARGQDLTYYEMKWWLDHMQAWGVNFMITHAFNPKSPYDTDCPPYFYNSGYEPRWPLYRVWADYTNRLSSLLHGGRHVCPVAFLFPGQSHHVGKSVTPERMTSALMDALLDSDWMPYEVFEGDASVDSGRLGLHDERYRVLVVPPVEVIPYETLQKVRQFFRSGGIVVGYNFLPEVSATLGHSPRDIKRLSRDIWGDAEPGLEALRVNSAGGRSYLLPEEPTRRDIRRALVQDADVHPRMDVIEGETDGWVHILHRVKAGRDVFLITNQNHEPPARDLRMRARAEGVPERWDAMRNEICKLPYERTGPETVEFDLTLQPNESVLVVFAGRNRSLPRRVNSVSTVRPSIALERQPLGRSQPPSGPSEKKGEEQFDISLAGCPWVWYPGENAVQSAPPEPRYFRRELSLSGGEVEMAKMLLCADNAASLYVNGERIGRTTSWKTRSVLDMGDALKPGANILAVAATNASNEPNPAGLLGRYVVRMKSGREISGCIDDSWLVSTSSKDGWRRAGFDTTGWSRAEVVAEVGDEPWGTPAEVEKLTPSPYEADYYRGTCRVPADVNLEEVRVMLELQGVPRSAADVQVNGKHAGGFIGAPFRVNVTEQIRAGKNEFRIAPMAPEEANLRFYEAGQ